MEVDELEMQLAGFDDAEVVGFDGEPVPDQLPIPSDPYAPTEAVPLDTRFPPAPDAQTEAQLSPEEIQVAWDSLTEGQRENYTRKPFLWRPGAIGHPIKKQRQTGILGPKTANRVNVREVVSNLCDGTGLGPIEVLTHLMLNTDESRDILGLGSKTIDKVTAALRAKCAMELLGYMAPKLKSVEVRSKGDKPSKTHVFLPKNEREQGELAAGPVLMLPEKDGQQVVITAEVARQIIGDDDEPDDDDSYEE